VNSDDNTRLAAERLTVRITLTINANIFSCMQAATREDLYEQTIISLTQQLEAVRTFITCFLIVFHSGFSRMKIVEFSQ